MKLCNISENFLAYNRHKGMKFSSDTPIGIVGDAAQERESIDKRDMQAIVSQIEQWLSHASEECHQLADELSKRKEHVEAINAQNFISTLRQYNKHVWLPMRKLLGRTRNQQNLNSTFAEIITILRSLKSTIKEQVRNSDVILPLYERIASYIDQSIEMVQGIIKRYNIRWGYNPRRKPVILRPEHRQPA